MTLAARQTALGEADIEANRQLTTMDGWRRFVARHRPCCLPAT